MGHLNETLQRKSVAREALSKTLLARGRSRAKKELYETLIASQVESAEVIRLSVCSDLRKNVILLLKQGTTALADLRTATGNSSTSLIHALRELEKEHLIYQDMRRNYELTNIGKIIALNLESLIENVNTITGFSKFWLEHDLSGIPEDFLKNIRCLRESQVLTSTPTDFFNAFSTFIALVEKAKVIKGVVPVCTPDLLEIYFDLATRGVPIELVLTHEVLTNVLELADHNSLKNPHTKNLKLFVTEQGPKTVFTVTNYFFILGLFRFDRSYDYSDQLLSYSTKGITWGRELFNEYIKSSKEFDLSH